MSTNDRTTDTARGWIDLSAGARCYRHGTDWRDGCRDCDHCRFPMPYDPVPSWLWRMGAKDVANGR